jgi:hypothetical protein
MRNLDYEFTMRYAWDMMTAQDHNEVLFHGRFSPIKRKHKRNHLYPARKARVPRLATVLGRVFSVRLYGKDYRKAPWQRGVQ